MKELFVEETVCQHCGCALEEGNFFVVEGDFYCRECFDNKFNNGDIIACGDCGKYVYYGNATYIEYADRFVCEDCAGENYIQCEDCDEYIYRDNVIHTYNERVICEDCYERGYAACESCDEIYPVEELDNNYCCPDCTDDGYIEEYGYKPVPQFVGSADYYFGTELEISNGGLNGRNAMEILDGIEDRFYAKKDGSIYYGFEIVSHPFADISELGNHLETICDRAESLGYDSDSSCGFHIHVSRDGFGNGTAAGNTAAIAKAILIIDRLWSDIVPLTRRNNFYYCNNGVRSCGGFKDKAERAIAIADNGGERYSAVNCNNASTIEFRLFAGSVDPDELRTALQFVDCIVRLSNALTFRKVEKIDISYVINVAKKLQYTELLESLQTAK